MNFRQPINGHSHSEYSLDGASTIDDIVTRNRKLGATYVAATEHGSMNSAMELYTSCKSQGVKPILGIELYLVPPGIQRIRDLYRTAYQQGRLKFRVRQDANADEVQVRMEAEVEKKVKNYYFHLTVHFKTYEAYQHFCQMTPSMNERAVIKWAESKPLARLEEIIPIRKDITVCSSCMIGPVARTYLGSQDGIIPSDPYGAEQYYCMLRELVGPDSFFVEIFPHDVTHDWVRAHEDENGRVVPGRFVANACTADLPGGDFQRKMNIFMLQLAAKYQDRAMVSFDSHFAEPSDKIIQDAKLGNGSEAWKFYNSYHVMSAEEAFLKLHNSLGVDEKTFEQWVDNSYEFASLFDSFKMPTSKDRWLLSPPPDDFLDQLKQKIDRYGRMDWTNQAMIDRLKKEIQVLSFNKSGKNLMNYLFTVEDIANFCRENHVLINVRGSAGGCLLLYLLGVSAVMPLVHDLKLERFITEGRINANTLPDVDIDVSDQEKVFEYLRGKYGDGFCRLSTNTLLHVKSSIKDAERFKYGYVRPETEAITVRLPNTPQHMDDYKFVFGYTDETGVKQPGLYESHAALREYADKNPDIWEMVKKMMGIQRNKSVHACGIIICDHPVQNFAPIIDINGTRVTGFDPHSIEDAGGVKFDILGLNTLRDIQLCTDSIFERTGQVIDPWKLPFDARCADKLIAGDTISVFQLDTPTARPLTCKIMKKERMNSLYDIAECMCGITSLGRPGTLDAPSGDGRTLAEVYVARANGEAIKYIHPDLEPILSITFGIQIYQEQTLQIFRDLANMSFEEAEVVRRAIGKKDAELLGKNFGRLKESCLKRGWTEDQVNLLIEQIYASSRYSFNKSHAMSYAYVAYACIWLRENHKLDWWKAILSNSDKDELATKFWKHVKDFTTLPQIDNLSNDFKIVDNKIVAPLGIISGLGEKTYQQVTQRGPYKDFKDFVFKHFTRAKKDSGQERNALNAPITYKMIIAGILDPLFPPGTSRADKISNFVSFKAEANNEKPKKIEKGYEHITSLGEYMIRKQLVKVHSEDLRELMLPRRGGTLVQPGVWKMTGPSVTGEVATVYIFGGEILEEQKQAAIQGNATLMEMRFLAYVVDEESKDYKNKTKSRTQLVLDINGYFFDDVLWPSYGEDRAATGFKGLPCLVIYEFTETRCFLKKLIPLLSSEDLKNVASVV